MSAISLREKTPTFKALLHVQVFMKLTSDVKPYDLLTFELVRTIDCHLLVAFVQGANGKDSPIELLERGDW